MNRQIGNRMKDNYEHPYRIKMPERIPVIVRIDGKAFHTWTKDMERPFDAQMLAWMIKTATYVLEETHTAQVAYIQSDEISILLHGYKKLDTCSYFNNEIQKIASVMAGLASAKMTELSGRLAVFDARCFVIPEDEVNNYFVWRQQDATRNSIQMVARSYYSHKEVHKKNTKELQEMLYQKGKNWNDLPTMLKRGSCVIRDNGEWKYDNEIPVFTQNKNYIEDLLKKEG